MYKLATLLILVLFTKDALAQFPLPYCSEQYTGAVEPITSVIFANIDQSSSAVINGSAEHQDFTTERGYVVPGGTYTITVQGNTNGNFLNLLRVYIDWNNDNDFADASEIYSLSSITNSTGTDAVVSTANIVIPAFATIGTHRMRVSKKRNSIPSACSASGFGQSEDYTIEVFSAAPYCNNHYPISIVPITNVSFARINNTTSAAIGATAPTEDFTNISTVVAKDSTYNLRVKGFANVNFYIRAFIDWNRDNDFLDANESYDVGIISSSTGTDGVFVSTMITVPANSIAGLTRMRVTKKTGGFAQPCDSVNRGQSEDYTINIVDNIRSVIDDENAYLQGDYVEVGINRCGSWGTFGQAPVEYHARSGVGVANPGNDMLNLGFIADPERNGWRVGSPNLYNGDYFLPASPFVGWGISIAGINYGTDRTNSTKNTCDNLPPGGTPMTGSNTVSEINGTKASATWQGSGSGILLKKITTVKQDKVYFTVQIKLYNTTANTIPNIYYGEYVNPDPDYFYNGVTTNVNNTNTIIYQNPADGKALIQAIGIPGLQSYIGLGSKDCRSKVLRGAGMAQVQPTGFALNWYNGSGGLISGGDDANPANNNFIGISFNIGSILPGDSTTFTYAYILKAEDFNDALDETDPTFTSNNITVPSGGTLTPCNNSTNTVTLNDADAYTWTWSPATGLNTTIGKQVNMTVTTTPIIYTLTGVALNGCGNKIVTLYVDPVNTTNIITPASISKCAGDPPVLITATGGSYTSAVIFREDFNNEGNSWNKFNNSTGGATANAAFTLRPNGYTYPAIPVTFNSNDNSQFYLTNSHAQNGGSATRTILQSQPLGTLNASSFTVNFYHYLRDPSSSIAAALETSTDGINWTNLQYYTSTQGSPNNFQFVSRSSPIPANYIRFRYTGNPNADFYWAIDNVKITTSGRPITWAPLTGLFTDADGTIPYTGTIRTTVYANPANTTMYTASSVFGNCIKTSSTNVIVNPLNSTLAGIIGSTVCQNKLVDTAGSVFNNAACNPIAKVKPAGANPVAGQINTCVYIDPAVLPFYNAEPYLQRHIDILPVTNAATSTGRITLYFTDAEFATYNANNIVWPDLPTVAGGGNADARRANLRVTQYHGTPNTNPSQPNNYTLATGTYINPNDNDIFWNGNYWEVSFDVSGFSGFYVHTNLSFPLPVNINYLNGSKQANTHLLEWKVTCSSSPSVTLALERSADSRTFNAINTINATALQCLQSFTYTDASPLPGINYYRLKVTDADGKITYSNTIALVNAVKGIYITGIAPNPINEDGSFKLNVTSAKTDKLEMVITDMQGRLVQKQFVTIAAGYNAVNMLVSGLAAGTYTLYGINTAGDKTKVIRFIKP